MSVATPEEEQASMTTQLANYRTLRRCGWEGWKDLYERDVNKRLPTARPGMAVACHYEYLLHEAIRQLEALERRQ